MKSTATIFGLNSIMQNYVDANGVDSRITCASGSGWVGVVVGGQAIFDWITGNVQGGVMSCISTEDWNSLTASYGVLIRSGSNGIFAVECYADEKTLFETWGSETSMGFISIGE